MEFIFHGTGSSSQLPEVPCITSADRIKDIRCRCCREAVAACVDLCTCDEEEKHDVLQARVVGGEKNKRGNPGGIIRKRGPDGEWRTIVIDVGKTFREQASVLFRKHRIKRIDAVILTHAHADAVAGLDDLRAFTDWGTPQQGERIPVYLSQNALQALSVTMPWIVDRSEATGSGFTSSLDFRVFDAEERSGEKGAMLDGFDVFGVWVVPLKVHHGVYFAKQAKEQEDDGISIQHKERAPFYCYGFLFDEKLAYMSDVSYIPSSTWQKLRCATNSPQFLKRVGNRSAIETGRGESGTIAKDETDDVVTPLGGLPFPASIPNFEEFINKTHQLPYLVLDCLQLPPHRSHFSFLQALSVAMKVSPAQTYLVGFYHPVSHNEWEAACREVQGIRAVDEEEGFMSAIAKSGMEHEVEMTEVWERARKE